LFAKLNGYDWREPVIVRINGETLGPYTLPRRHQLIRREFYAGAKFQFAHITLYLGSRGHSLEYRS